jgi:flavin reductase (DIM6/NTAB) family NADH-FMN oxidoreductase RutF
VPAELPDSGSAAVDGPAFRAALGRFASGVTVVSTVHDGVDSATTVSAFTSVSLDPPLVLVSIGLRNRFSGPVLASGVWGVSVLREDGHGAASWFARHGRDLTRPLHGVAHHRGSATGVALIDAALAWLECRTWRAYDGADHTLLVGTVVAATVAAGEASDPLLYFRSHYAGVVPWPISERSDPALDAAEGPQ